MDNQEVIKDIACDFFYWWHNQPGNNTRAGFDDYAETALGKARIQYLQASLASNTGSAEPVGEFQTGFEHNSNVGLIQLLKGKIPPGTLLFTATQPAVPEWLMEMSHQMREQPSRATAHPFWQVRCKRYIPTAEGYNEHHKEVAGDDGVIWRSDCPLSELIDYLLENHTEWCATWAGDHHPGDDPEEALNMWFGFDEGELPDGLTLLAVQEIEEVVSTHLTEAGAEQFIKRKQHDHPPLYTYVESAYWSPQLRQLQDWIIGLTDASNAPVTDPSPEQPHDQLIFVGYTNGAQVLYGAEGEGTFYSNTDNDCCIPLYMLRAHWHRLESTTNGEVTLERLKTAQWGYMPPVEQEKPCTECGSKGCDGSHAEFLEYRALLEEGYRREDAAVRSGWKGAEEI
ncbi:hypothetical protein [Microbulbifer agarilyticus]